MGSGRSGEYGQRLTVSVMVLVSVVIGNFELIFVLQTSKRKLEVEDSNRDNGDLNESKKTVKIGNEIVFDISIEDPIPVETMSDRRENNVSNQFANPKHS
ncbi:unnamed protein product [Lactuca saligna]|uniref:Uncharacterized protein n=1 Tax=Lactuca saligna TaxID=75948 RepID=A0AA35YZY1_LACSI|nr:unnamed protein product [Lactuca saligna]